MEDKVDTETLLPSFHKGKRKEAMPEEGRDFPQATDCFMACIMFLYCPTSNLR